MEPRVLPGRLERRLRCALSAGSSASRPPRMVVAPFGSPASLCGLVGLKPTNGVVGRWPAPDWIDYSTDGPFATSCDDLCLIFDVMRGPVAGDPTAPPRESTVEGIRHEGRPLRLIAAERTSPLGPLPHVVAHLFHDGVDAVAERLKATVTWMSAEEFFQDGDPDLDWFTVTSAEHVSALGREWTIDHMDEFHVATQEVPQRPDSLSRSMSISPLGGGAIRTCDAWIELLSDGGASPTPSVAAEGWLADGRMTEDAAVHGLAPEVYSTAVQNVTGHPAISIPFGAFPRDCHLAFR